MKCFILTFCLALATSNLFSKQIEVSGSIHSSEGEPLVGVNIVEKGTTNGTISDQYGKFTIAVQDSQSTLIISYLGYIGQEIVVGDKTEMNIILEEDQVNLDEVVVIGYGTAKKSDLTGAVSSVKPSELNISGISNAAQMLQGRVTGLYISSHDQNPGSTPAFILRGAGSFQEGEAGQPLVVIDGFPMENASYINTINPSDIEQIDVLKDASSTAIYGSRGANGVIIITTKHGNTSGIQVNYGAKFYTQTIARTVDMMNAQQYARFYYDLAHDPDLQLGTYGPEDGYPHEFNTWDNLKNTNWQKEIVNKGNMTQEHNLSLSGVKEGVKYRAAANYYNGNGIISPSGYERINTVAKLDYDYKKFSFNLNVNFTNENRNQLQNSFERALGFSPSTPIYDSLGNLSKHAFTPISSWYYNPLFPSQAEERFSESNTTRISGGVEYEIMKGLRASAKGGITQNAYESFYQRFKPLFESQKETEASISTTNNRQIYADYFLRYNKQIEDHKFSIMVGGSYRHSRNRGHWASSVDFPYINIGYYNIDAGLLNRSMGSSWYERRVVSGLGRINYDYQGKYLVTLNYRLDGATVFGKDNKWGHFPSFGLAYRIDQEDYFKDNVNFLSILKLRTGYGIAGNANIPGFRTQNLLDFRAVYEGGGISNAIVWGSDYLPNPDLHWENTYTFNLGLEFGNPMFYAELNYYATNHEDLILDRQVPTELGFTNITVNKGAMLNTGLEAKLDLFLNFFDKKFKWKPGIWASYNRNEITNLDGDIVLDKDIWIDRTNYGYAGIKQKGYPLNAIWGYEYLGVWQSDETAEAAAYKATPGDPKFADLNSIGENGEAVPGSDGKITEHDKIFLGDANPKFTGGIRNQLNYKNLELSFFFEGVFDKAIVNVNKSTLTYPSNVYGANRSVHALNRWTPSNPTNEVPSLTKNLTEQMVRSTWGIEDGSFIRLRDITFTYKHYFKEGQSLKNLSVFISASNLVTITKYSGINPDVWATDVSYNLMPFPRVFTLGANVSF